MRCHLLITLFTATLTGAWGSPTRVAAQDDRGDQPPTAKRSVTGDTMKDEQIAAFANLVLEGINREFPNKPSNVMQNADDVRSPREMHPAFFGSFDWHSAVHGHWMLVRLLKRYPGCSVESEIREELDRHLTAEKLEQEAAYFRAHHNRSFERMYGWAWTFRLVAELHEWEDAQARQWRAHLQPLEQIIRQRTLDYLPKLTYPIRTGVHPDTAFALAQTLDYARIVGDTELEQLVVDRARDYFQADRNYNSEFEPSGEDFFSSALNEADLMRRILPTDAFAVWLKDFLPQLVSGDSSLLRPVEVSDVTDGKIVHLAGLDLSRAWCLQGIAASLPADEPELIQRLQDAAQEHAKMGFNYVFSGHYEGEHWLATFAVYVLTKVGVGEQQAR